MRGCATKSNRFVYFCVNLQDMVILHTVMSTYGPASLCPVRLPKAVPPPNAPNTDDPTPLAGTKGGIYWPVSAFETLSHGSADSLVGKLVKLAQSCAVPQCSQDRHPQAPCQNKGGST
eukprot:1161210-Pelagomonas_calceolata.AAC.15